MSVSLPNEINYFEGHPSLPDNCVATTVTLSPVNGAGPFTQNSMIMFDFLNKGFIVPDSIILKYNYKVVSATNISYMIGIPLYTPFARAEVLIGSQVCESIQQYNQVACMLTNLSYDIATKYGQQSALGVTGTSSIADMDGRAIPAVGETGTFSGPLPCCLSLAEKLIPAFATPQLRLQLTMDSLANMFFNSPATTTDFQLSNVELSYSCVTFGHEVENLIRNSGPKLHIKSQSFVNSSTALANNTSGLSSLVFNNRLASIKSAFAIFASKTGNYWGDAMQPSTSCDYQLFVGGISYPQRPLSVTINRSGILQELRRAMGSIYDKNNTMSINDIEWTSTAGVTTTSAAQPGKHFVGFALEKLHSGALLTGISTENSSLTLNCNFSAATQAALNVNLILNYDMIFEIDLENRMCSVKQ